ncbi:isoprenyl transferase [Candidatus Aerophobetes bacterium]|uniref:Isoprenyl transferase n=1 Tax=Aerophobetes bacterium TaxID=2030807 RepID=A0A523ZGU7_UNCAE|nr:MAG: isoprenyl transferase [Candidatus Aerophobetes bacterium]
MIDISKDELPQHIAIIMDGNGRWAKKRGLTRSVGHRAGMEKIREITQLCSDFGIKILTIYAFSCQNWKRPRREVNFLMSGFKRYLDKEKDDLNKKGTRFRVIGRRRRLSSSLQNKIEEVMSLTKDNKDFFLNLAIDYGGQEEIIDAAKALIKEVVRGNLAVEEIDMDLFRQYLYLKDLPSPDLLIRTGGEYRVSNFLLWHIAYTELWMTPVFWPDFGKKEFLMALKDYAKRERRFGKIREE